MLLTTLATIARDAGLSVVEQPGWRSRGHGGMDSVQAVIIHHTAGAKSGNAPSLGVVTQGRADLAGPLAHFLIGRDGTVFVIAAGLCWHAGAVKQAAWSNANAIGIEMEGTGTEAWPDYQIKAAAKLSRALCDAFRVPMKSVLGHKEVCAPTGRKIDPNYDMVAFRAKVALANGGNAVATEITEEGAKLIAKWVWRQMREELDIDMSQMVKDIWTNTGGGVARTSGLENIAAANYKGTGEEDDAHEQWVTARENTDAISRVQTLHTDQLNKIATGIAELTGQTG